MHSSLEGEALTYPAQAAKMKTKKRKKKRRRKKNNKEEECTAQHDKHGVSECRVEVWPYLERFAEDATKAVKKEEEEEEEEQSRTGLIETRCV